MPRINAFWLSVPALICAAAPSALAVSLDSQAIVRVLRERNDDKGLRIGRRLAEIEGSQLTDAQKAKAKDDFLKAEIEKAEADQRVAAEFGGPEGQQTAREVTALLKALRENERWQADPRPDKESRDNMVGGILLREGNRALMERVASTKIVIRDEHRRNAEEDLKHVEEMERQQEEEQRRRTSQAPSNAGGWENAIRYAGEFSGFRISNGPGFMGEERVGTTNRHLGIVQPDKSSGDALRSSFSAAWNVSSSVDPMRLWTTNVPAQTWVAFGGQTVNFDRRSSWDRLDVGAAHRILIPGTGDPGSPDREGFSIGPGGGFNLVRDLVFQEETDLWTVWGKFGQTCDYGDLTLSGYALAAYSQIETSQHFSGRLPNVPPSFDFRYDTRVDTGAGSFGIGLQAEYPLGGLMPNLSVTGGALATADFVRSSGRDHLRVERPGFFVRSQSVAMRETSVEAGYELNLGLKYKFDPNWAVELAGRYGNHQTGIGVARIGTEPSRIDHIGQDSWGVGLGITWTR